MIAYVSPLLSSYMVSDRPVLWTWRRMKQKTKLIWKARLRQQVRVVLIDVYGDRKTVLAVPESPKFERVLDAWHRMEKRYRETGAGWIPIKDWLARHNIPILDVKWEAL